MRERIEERARGPKIKFFCFGLFLSVNCEYKTYGSTIPQFFSPFPFDNLTIKSPLETSRNRYKRCAGFIFLFLTLELKKVTCSREKRRKGENVTKGRNNLTVAGSAVIFELKTFSTWALVKTSLRY